MSTVKSGSNSLSQKGVFYIKIGDIFKKMIGQETSTEKAKREKEKAKHMAREKLKKEAERKENAVFYEDDVVRLDILSERSCDHTDFMGYDVGAVYHNNNKFTFFNKQTGAEFSFQDNRTSGYDKFHSYTGGIGEAKPIPEERVYLYTHDGKTENISGKTDYLYNINSLIKKYVDLESLALINKTIDDEYCVWGGKEIKRQVSLAKEKEREELAKENKEKEQERLAKEKNFNWLKENFKTDR